MNSARSHNHIAKNLNEFSARLFRDFDYAFNPVLDYVDGQPPADDFVKEIDGEVIRAKRREDWRREYMTLNILIAREKKKSEEQGRIKGRNEAIINSIRAIMQTLNYSAEKAMEILKIPRSEYSRYLNLLQE